MTIKERSDLTEEIKGALKERGVGVSQLAEKLGVLQPSMSRTIRRSGAWVSELLKICEAIDADLEISIKLRD